jgi:hypothetical protein
MSIDIFDIIIIIVCIILTICAILFINRNIINYNICRCCNQRSKSDNAWDTFGKQVHNNSMEDNIKIIKNMENNNKDEVELL